LADADATVGKSGGPASETIIPDVAVLLATLEFAGVYPSAYVVIVIGYAGFEINKKAKTQFTNTKKNDCGLFHIIALLLSV
jgi:hypothetical protein